MSKEKINIRYLRDERNRGSVMKVLNDFLVDIMGAIIPGFLFIFSFGIALGVPIILIYDISIPKSFYNSIVSFGAIILILLLSYVIGHAFYRADINQPDKASIAKKMRSHIKDVCKECRGKVEKRIEKPEGPSECIPDDICYRMKHMLLDRKYLDSSRDKSLAHYVSLFYNELISRTQNDSNTDNVFYIIKKHFDGTENLNKLSDQGNESKDIATRNDYFNLIDIISDCIEYVVNCYLSQLECLITNIIPGDKDCCSIVIYMKVFFKEIKFIDYCDNYNENKYLLDLINTLKELSSYKLDKEKTPKENLDSFYEKLLAFREELGKYKEHILMDSGVTDLIIENYKTIIDSELHKDKKTAQKNGKETELKKGEETEPDINKDITEKIKCVFRELQYDLRLYTSIRRMQNEEGTPHKDAGGFPYINYENYLFKRNLHHLAEMVNWNNREGRTKNQINRYKIKIQLFCPDAYGVLNKNESHVRMASSSWFVAKFLMWTSGVIIVVIILLLFSILLPIPKESRFDYDFLVNFILPLLPPLSVGVLLYLLKRRIEDFIHYQRLREIYFALYTYHECKNEIRYKEEYYAHCPFPDKDIVEYENESVKQQ